MKKTSQGNFPKKGGLVRFKRKRIEEVSGVP